MMLLRRCALHAASRPIHTLQTFVVSFSSHTHDTTRLVAQPVVEEFIGAYTPVTKALWTERGRWDHAALEALTPCDQIISKPPHVTSVLYPFTTDPTLREQYRNPWGFVRIGRLLEDLDSLAGNVAYKHCESPDPTTRPRQLVTAAVDAIHVRGSIPMDRDLHMAGQVVWTGRASLDIRMTLQEHDDAEPMLIAMFTFVAVDPITRASVPINKLMPHTAAEHEIFKERQRIAEARKRARATDALVQGGAANLSRSWTESLLSEATTRRDLPALAPTDALLMHETALENAFICQPQQRNMYGRIFGGFLMRRAYELAWATGFQFLGTRPVFVEVDEITFKRPVDVGDLLRLRSRVLWAAPKSTDPTQAVVHVQVVASVSQPEFVKSDITNTFVFVFEVDVLQLSRGLKRILPATAEEASLLASFHPW